jgi:hypothetical protein
MAMTCLSRSVICARHLKVEAGGQCGSHRALLAGFCFKHCHGHLGSRLRNTSGLRRASERYGGRPATRIVVPTHEYADAALQQCRVLLPFAGDSAASLHDHDSLRHDSCSNVGFFYRSLVTARQAFTTTIVCDMTGVGPEFSEMGTFAAKVMGGKERWGLQKSAPPIPVQ